MGQRCTGLPLPDDVVRLVAGFLTTIEIEGMRIINVCLNRIIGHTQCTILTDTMTPAFMHLLTGKNWFLTKLTLHLTDNMHQITQFESHNGWIHHNSLPTVTYLVLITAPAEALCLCPLSEQMRQTPTLLLKLASRLQKLDIVKTNAHTVQMIRGMGQQFPCNGIELRMCWQHIKWIQELTQWETTGCLDNIIGMHVTCNQGVSITKASFQLLYIWATEVGKGVDGPLQRNKKLWLVIPRFTDTIHTELRAAFCASFDQNRIGLSEFHLHVQNVDNTIDVHNTLIGNALLLFACSNTSVFLHVTAHAGDIYNSVFFVYGVLYMLSVNVVCRSLKARLSFWSDHPIPNHVATFRLLDAVVTQYTIALMRSVRFYADPTEPPPEYMDYINNPLFTMYMQVHLHASQQYTFNAHGHEECEDNMCLVYLIRSEMIARGAFTIKSTYRNT
jgi:hypothetical protein